MSSMAQLFTFGGLVAVLAQVCSAAPTSGSIQKRELPYTTKLGLGLGFGLGGGLVAVIVIAYFFFGRGPQFMEYPQNANGGRREQDTELPAYRPASPGAPKYSTESDAEAGVPVPEHHEQGAVTETHHEQGATTET